MDKNVVAAVKTNYKQDRGGGQTLPPQIHALPPQPKRQPFSQAFSARRVTEPSSDRRLPRRADGNIRRPATTPAKVNAPWYEGEVPSDWTEEERQFVGNWIREQAKLHDLLLSRGIKKFLRKARKIHLKLADELDRQLFAISREQQNKRAGGARTSRWRDER